MSDTNRHGSVVSFPDGGAVQPHQPFTEQPEIRLPRRISPVAVVVIALPFIWCLASVAFTQAGMQRFTALTVYHLQWLIGSQDGNRVGSFVLFGLGVAGLLGFLRHTIIKYYGLGVLGWTEISLGISLSCGAYFEWHLGQLWWPFALGIGWAGYILASWGWRNIKNDQGPLNPAPQFQAQTLPEQTVYGAARNASDDEIDAALRDKSSPSNSSYRFKE